MKLIKNLIIILAVVAVFIYGILFALYNEQNVSLDFLFVDSILIPLSIWSGGLVVLGILFGILIATLSKIGTGLENKRLKKELKQANVELEKKSNLNK